jgi:hypothetical protein
MPLNNITFSKERKMKSILVLLFVALACLFIVSMALAQSEPPPDSVSTPANPPAGYEVVFNVLVILVPMMVVPIVGWLKTLLKINDLSLLNYLLSIATCFALALLLTLVMVPNWDIMNVVTLVFIFFPISSLIHAGWKQTRSAKTTAFRPA